MQNWNVTLERQLGTDWGVAVSYLGSYSDRLWSTMAINPGVFMGLGPCTIQGVAYPVCSTNANLNVRRVLYEENPREAQFLGAIDLNDDIGWQEYHGLKLSAQRRSAGGLSLNANYTLSRCIGTDTPNTFNQISSATSSRTIPSSIAAIAIRITGTWRLSPWGRRRLTSVARSASSHRAGAPRASSASATATASTSSLARTMRSPGYGISGPAGQRRSVRQSADIDELLQSRRLRAARTGNLRQPAPQWRGRTELLECGSRHLAGAGDRRDAARWSSARGVQSLQHFNWGDPADAEAAGGATSTFGSAQFGRITTQAGSPRIIQLGVKYAF